MPPKIIRKIGIAILQDKKILMARSKKNTEIFYVPGGKLEQGESDIECLKRECKEELNVEIKTESIQYLNTFEGPAHGQPEGTLINTKLYLGEPLREPKASSEIEEIKYFSSQDQKQLSEFAAHYIFPWLKDNNYIN